MPVEIRELVIRAVAVMDVAADDASSEAEGLRPPTGIEGRTEAIIQECVRQVLRILHKEQER